MTTRASVGAMVGRGGESDARVPPCDVPSFTMSLLQILTRGIGLQGIPLDYMRDKKLPPYEKKKKRKKKKVRALRYSPPCDAYHPSNLLVGYRL